MKLMRAIFLMLIVVFSLDACSPANESDNSDGVPGLDRRVANGACVAPALPDADGVSLAKVFQASNMNGLLDMVRGPSRYPAWWGIQQNGNVLVLEDSSIIDAQVVLRGADLKSFVSAANSELGLLGMSIEPLYTSPQATLANNQFRLYVYYTSNGCFNMGTNLCSRVSRFVISRSVNGSYSAGNEEVLMEFRQYASNHNGGAMRFGPDQYLYFTLGDGGSANDPACAAQNLASPLGKLLRIDVNTQTGYRVPASNPFSANAKCDQHSGVGSAGIPDNSRQGDFCPEVVAYGLRNPFRISFDSVTGYVWIGDVGQDEVEEIDKFASSPLALTNFGWPLREGPDSKSNSACNSVPSAPAAYQSLMPTQFTNPVFFARHSANSLRGVIVNGGVYRGSQLGSTYNGSYFFQDAQSGEHWIQANPYQAELVDVDQQAVTYFPGVRAYGYSEDDNHELVMLNINDTPQRIVAATGTVSNFPQNLSQTGCFDALDPTQPSAALIPYDVISPLWLDGASKRRYLSIPDGSKIGVDSSGKFEMPVGSLLFKEIRAADGNLLETRMLVKHSALSWGAYSYAWNASKTDATLVTNGQYIAKYNWIIPSQAQCMSCHNQITDPNTLAIKDVSIGLEYAQLNHDFVYPVTARRANQIDTLAQIGVLDSRQLQNNYPVLVNPLDPQNAIELAARSYLHGNCAYCHQPGGYTQSDMNLLISSSLANSNSCDTLPMDSQRWGDQVRLIAPQHPENSLIRLRMADLQSARMPPQSSVVVDQEALSVITNWIAQLQSCP